MTTRTNPVNKYTSRAEVIAVAMIRLGGLTAYTTSWFADPREAVRAALHNACDTAAEYRDGCVMYCIPSAPASEREDLYVGVDAARLMTPAEAAILVRKMPRHEDDDEKAIEALAAKIEKCRRLPC